MIERADQSFDIDGSKSTTQGSTTIQARVTGISILTEISFNASYFILINVY